MRSMKLGWLGAMTIGGLIALQPLAQAQEKKQDKPATPATPAAPAATPAAPRAPPPLSPDLKARQIDAQVNSWAKMYGLTDEQKTKAKPIVEERFKKMGELDRNLPIEERRKKSMEIQQSTLAKLKAILTPEQRQKMESLPQRGLRPAPGAPGAPGAPANPAAPK